MVFVDFVSENTLSEVKSLELERRVGKMTYPVGDFLIRVKNAAMAGRKEITILNSGQIFAISETLKKLGFLDEIKKDGKNLKLSLTFKRKKPLLINIKLVSKPGLRVYAKASEIEGKRGPSTFIISSPQGVISSKEAIKSGTGGEIIAEVL